MIESLLVQFYLWQMFTKSCQGHYMSLALSPTFGVFWGKGCFPGVVKMGLSPR